MTWERDENGMLQPKRPVGHGMSRFEIGARKIALEMAGCPILARNISASEFRQRCQRREFPVGAQWRSDGNVYGPKEKQNANSSARAA